MKLIIDENTENERIDSFLADILSDYSRTKIQACIKNGDVKVNQKKVKASYLLKLGDFLEFEVQILKNKTEIKPENIPLNIVWEDENMAVINKPSGMLTHPTSTETSGTLVNALLFKYGANLSNLGGVSRQGIVHRLDRNTSGLIMIAKNNKTHEFLVEEMKNKHFTKKYIAIVKGVIDKDEFAIDSPIGRHETQPHKQTVRDDGKESLTIVKVLERYKDATLVELTLITGRTHQIRVHMSSIGHPVYNDTLYGFGKIKIKTEEQVLESYKLEFTQPFTNNRILLKIDPDAEFQKVLNYLK
jgi:23S rRNA pseudouridine1911/1915/1917 synthase